MTSRTVYVDRWFYAVDVSIIDGTPAPPAPVVELVDWLREGNSLEETHAIALLDEIAALRKHVSSDHEPAQWAHTEWEWS